MLQVWGTHTQVPMWRVWGQMIIQPTPTMMLNEIISKQRGTYADVLPYLWTVYQCTKIQIQSKNKYQKDGLFNNTLHNTLKWIESDPARTIIRLWRNGDECVYCRQKIIPTKNTEGDHIVGRENLNGASWQVPCCHTVRGQCQSSKLNRDLLEWWYKKDRGIDDLQKDVLSIYIRGKYRVLKNSNRLSDIASTAHHFYLQQMWGMI